MWFALYLQAELSVKDSKNINFKGFVLCLAERKERDIKLPHTSGKSV